MKDIVFNEDIEIKDGDFQIEISDQQNISHLLVAHQGAYKEFPLFGIGIQKYSKGNTTINRLRLEAELEKQLTYDGFTISELKIGNLENIIIDGNY